MATFQLAGSKITVKYLVDNNGTLCYQRRVPDDLIVRLGKKAIRKSLDPKKGSLAKQAEEMAKSDTALFKFLRNHPDMPLSEQKIAALALLNNFHAQQGDMNVKLSWPNMRQEDIDAGYNDQPHLEGILDYLQERSVDFGGEGLNEVEKLAYRALKQPLPLLLSELPETYFKHHPKGTEEKYRKTTLMYWNKLIGVMGDGIATELTRDQARLYIETRLNDGMKTQTVQKEVNLIRAIFTKAIRELSLNIRNPFESLNIPNLGKDADKRDIFSINELRKIASACIEKDDEIRRMILLQLFTGSRISEVAGLRKQDVILNPVPYAVLEEHDKRGLKNGNSVRVLPLVKPALEVVLKQLEEVQGAYLFPRYNQQTKTSGGAASATVNKFLENFYEGKKKTSHCFRHSLTTLLRNADVTRDVKDELTGHRKQSMSDNYGEGYALNKKLDALNKAYKEVLQ